MVPSLYRGAVERGFFVNSTVKTIIFWVFILACLVLLWQIVQKSTGVGHDREISFSQFMQDAQQAKIGDVTVINNSEVRGHYASDREAFHTIVPSTYPDMYKILQENKVVVTIKDAQGNSWLPILLNFAPIIVIAALWFFMLRQMQSGGNKALSFGKSRARLLSMQQKKITFKDVAGVDEAKEELKEIIEFLREAQKFQKLGGRIPKGVLLVGPPGTGKTLLARAVAGEANVPFFSISGSAGAGCVICSNRVRRMLPASSLSTRSMPWEGTAEPAWVVAMTSASRP